jgi:ADP-ribosylglycohydrolase
MLNGVVRMRQFYNHNREWLHEYDHNHLRITRIITSLKLLVSKSEARDFHAFILDTIKDEGVVINSESLKYWQRAVGVAESKTTLQEKYQGSMLGLAIGDALGVPVEFKYEGEFEPVTDFMDANNFGLPAGHWSDDTAMALCLANSLIEKKGFDPLDQMMKYKEWLESGYCSSTGISVGIGQVVHTALRKFDEDGNPYAAVTYKQSDGNGSLMRIAPIALYYRNNIEDAMKYAELSSLVTHGSKLASDACKYYTGLIIGALQGEPKETLLSGGYSPISDYWTNNTLSQEIEEVAYGSFKIKSPPDIKGSGYVVKSLEAALWAFYNSDSYEEGVLMAVNLGDDADTIAAIYGQLAGAFYGVTGIPKKWVEDVAKSSEITELANELLEEKL